MLGLNKNQKLKLIYSSVTDGIHPFSVVAVVEDLTCDWLQHDKHSRHIFNCSWCSDFHCNFSSGNWDLYIIQLITNRVKSNFGIQLA